MPSLEKTSTEFGGFDLLSAGFHHVFVLDTDAAPTSKKDGRLLDGGELSLSGLAGTPEAKDKSYPDKGRVLKQYFPMPNPTQKDKGKMSTEKLTNLLIACGLMDEGKRGGSIDFEWEQMKHKQFVLKISHSTSKSEDGKEYTNADLDGVHIYHVADPRVAHVPKCRKSLEYIGYELAADGKTVTKKAGASGNGSQAKVQPQGELAGATAGGGGLDLDAL